MRLRQLREAMCFSSELLNIMPNISRNFDPAAEWKSHIPVPVNEEHPEYLELYWKAWELAHDHIKDIPGLPQTPYMDEGAGPYDIWIWDTCFMALFCKYAQNRFPGVESFNNFYSVLYDGAKLPVLRHPPTGEDVQFCIHIADNPPLFAWTEYENLLMNGDKEHLKALLLEKQYLQKHFDYLENLTEYGTHPPMIRAVTCWKKHEHGYFWEGGRSGMDNTPRGRRYAPTEVNRPDNKHVLWVDAIAQQALSALYIAKLAKILQEKELEKVWLEKYEILKEKINTFYWDEEDGFYYDIVAQTGEKVKVMTPASFWVLLAEAAPQERAERMAKYLTDPEKLGGKVPCVTLARDDADFNGEHGLYWRGAMWVPTAYMTIKALEKYGMKDLARELSVKILEHMSITFQNYTPHTIWECYAPNSCEPSRSCNPSRKVVRKDFCGWSALAPISLLLENLIGIRKADAFDNTLIWDIPEKNQGGLGVYSYKFGDVTADLLYKNNEINISSDKDFSLVVHEKTFSVKAGRNTFKVKE